MRAKLWAVAAALVVPASAAAFCGFFVSGADAKLVNNASQVVLMRSGNRTVMTMSNNYKGPPENFAMVVPVPVVLQKENVKVLPHDVFDHIDRLSAPRLVEYWEQDPCRPIYPERRMKAMSAPAPATGGRASGEDLGVRVLARFEVGEYQVVILSAEDSSGLDTWLRKHHYHIPDGAAAALAPYVRDQMKFFVAKVDIQKVQRDSQGLVVLSPLRFHFESSELKLPVRLGLLNAEAKQDLIVYVLSPDSRYEVSNYRTVEIPTNVEVTNDVRENFPGFYAELFDATLRHYEGRAVVTEYAWDTNSCDPCPSPPLSPSELMTLGGDVLSGEPPPPQQPVPPGRPNRMMFRGGSRFVLTRLHTRYDRQALSSDLVFQRAPALEGGRGFTTETRTSPGGMNNFQARYIIRHYWAGKVECEHPQFGNWGGPPNGGQEQAQAATGLANAARGKVALTSVVNTPLPALGLKGRKPPTRRGQ
jgi:hypothetical protein